MEAIGIRKSGMELESGLENETRAGMRVPVKTVPKLGLR